MSARCKSYTLHVHPMPAWRDDEGYSALGFIDDPQHRRVGSLMLRGPFQDWGQARQAALAALQELACELEDQQQEPWFAPY